MVKRGEVWLAALDPTSGAEIQKTRPCLVVSPDELNGALRTVLIAPMTTGGRPASFRVAIRFRGKTGILLGDQIRAVDKSRLIARLGRLEARALAEFLRVMEEMFAP